MLYRQRKTRIHKSYISTGQPVSLCSWSTSCCSPCGQQASPPSLWPWSWIHPVRQTIKKKHPVVLNAVRLKLKVWFWPLLNADEKGKTEVYYICWQTDTQTHTLLYFTQYILLIYWKHAICWHLRFPVKEWVNVRRLGRVFELCWHSN